MAQILVASALALATLGGLALATTVLSISTASADDEQYKYKFPCRADEDECYVTTLAHADNALDFDIMLGGLEGLGEVRAVSEASYAGFFITANYCHWPDQIGDNLGQYAIVNDIHGRTLKYAHLTSVNSNLDIDDRVLQGDLIGIEGNVGFSENCAPHLHLSGVADVDYIDGIPTSTLAAPPPTNYQSSNSVVGNFTFPGGSIRQQYLDLGAVYGSWWTVGYTADWTSSQSGCGSAPPPSAPFCRLYVHYVPDPQEGHWGSVQVFRQDPSVPVFNDNAIMVGRWDDPANPNDPYWDAYWMEEPFFAAWLAGLQSGGLPVMDMIPAFGNLCPLALDCVHYQRLSVGYIWEHDTLGVQPTVVCPDVVPYYPNQDFSVGLADIFEVAEYFGNADGGAPFSPWTAALYDLDGDGAVALGDVFEAAGHFGRECWPGGAEPNP